MIFAGVEVVLICAEYNADAAVAATDLTSYLEDHGATLLDPTKHIKARV